MPYDEQDNEQFDQNEGNYQDDNGISEKQPLSRSQKIGTGILAVFGVLVVIFWFAQFKNSINSPLAYNSENDNAGASSTADILNDEALKAKDTDNDGISDYDEINIYHTSAYLADTDSDGIPDMTEIQNGTDPNCAEGKDCYGSSLVNPVATTSASDLSSQDAQGANNQITGLLSDTSTKTSGLPTVSNPTDLTAADAQLFLSGKADATTVRKLFIKLGAGQDELNKYTDEQLLTLYRAGIASSGTSTETTAGLSTTNVNNTDMQNVLSGQTDAATLRQTLIKSGMDKAMLDKFTDEELMKTYKDLVKKK